MAELTNEEIANQLADLKKAIDDHDKTLLEHSDKHDAQEKVNKSVGVALKKAGTVEVKTETPAAPKKKEPLITPKKEFEVNGEKYVFTGPKAKDKNGNVVLTATIAESPDEYQDELAGWAANQSGILKKLKK